MITGLTVSGPHNFNSITHADLRMGVETTANSYDARRDSLGTMILNEVAQVGELLSGVEGFQGCLGLGYPFYAIDETSGTVCSAPTIDTFLRASLEKIEESRATVGEAWPCVECQAERQLPDLKTVCKPCDRTVFKPRDLFRALPDIDIVTVFDQPTRETEATVQKLIATIALSQSDPDIAGTFRKTIAAMNGDPEAKLPIDIHVWPLEEVKACCNLIHMQPDNVKDNIIKARSLHMTWEDNPFNFWLDFVLGLEPVGSIDPNLASIIQRTRAALIGAIGVERAIELVAKGSARCGELLQDDQMSNNLRQRLAKWE